MAKLYVISPCKALNYGQMLEGKVEGKYLWVGRKKYDIDRFSLSPPPEEQPLALKVRSRDAEIYALKKEKEFLLKAIKNVSNRPSISPEQSLWIDRISRCAELAKEYNAEAYYVKLLTENLL